MNNIDSIDWNAVHQKYSNYLKRPVEETKPSDIEIDALINKAKNDFSYFFNLNSDKSHSPNVKKILATLKLVKEYSLKQKFINKKFNSIIGNKDEKITQLDRLIQTMEKEINQKYAKSNKREAEFKQKDLNFLSVLNKYRNGADVTEKEKQEFSAYLKNAKKMSHLKKLIKEIKNESSKVQSCIEYSFSQKGIDKRDLSFFQELMPLFSFSNKKQLSVFASKAENLWNNYEKGQGDKGAEKLNMREFALFDLINQPIPRDIAHLAQLGVLGKNMEALAKLTLLKSDIFAQVTKEISDNFSNGLAFQDMDRRIFIRHQGEKNFKIEVQRQATQSHYRHVGIFYSDQMGVYQSHILEKYQKDPLCFEHLVENCFFTLDWNKLISQVNQNKLKKIYGEEWREEIQKNYQSISQEFHKGHGKFEPLKNKFLHQIMSVVKPSSSSESSTKQLNLESFNRKEMFCSEFVAMSLVYTLNQLQQKIRSKGKEVEDFNIKLPFEENTNFASMHPGKLMKNLKNCTIEMDIPPIVKHFVDFNS